MLPALRRAAGAAPAPGEHPDSSAGTTALCGAGVYVAASLAPGMAAGAAALWVAQHAPDPSTVYALNHLRTFSYQMSLMAWAVFFAAVAVSGLAGHTLPRWLGASAAAVAAALAVGVVGAYDHWHDPSPPWSGWSGCSPRRCAAPHPRRAGADVARPRTTARA